VNGMMDDLRRRIYRMADPFGCRVNRVRMMGSALGFIVSALLTTEAQAKTMVRAMVRRDI
jgi:hypothetical protein